MIQFLGRSMNMSPFRAIPCLILALAMLSLASPLSAQQAAPPAPKQVPAPTQVQAPPAAAAVAPVAVAPVQAPASPAAAPSAEPAPQAIAAPGDSESKPLKSTSTGMHELSPWLMFMSADVIVKAVMIGLAFASLVTWTIFIAKMIELTVVQNKLRGALAKIREARSLAEAQFALAIKCVLSFGHLHESFAQAAPDATRHLVRAAATHASYDAWHVLASWVVRSKTPAGHHSDDGLADDCPICAVLALANAPL